MLKLEKGDCFYNTENAGNDKSILNYTIVLDIIEEEDELLLKVYNFTDNILTQTR